MRSDDILDAIGEVDEALVKSAKEIRRSHKTLWITLSSVAACLIIAYMIPLIFISLRGAGSAAPDKGDSPPDNEGAADQLFVYYVEGEELAKERIAFSQVKDVFDIWREKNGLGDDVEFKNHYILSSDDDPSSVTTLILVISSDIRNYYGDIDEELLLRSLTLTMTEYFDIPEDSFVLSLQ